MLRLRVVTPVLVVLTAAVVSIIVFRVPAASKATVSATPTKKTAILPVSPATSTACTWDTPDSSDDCEFLPCAEGWQTTFDYFGLILPCMPPFTPTPPNCSDFDEDLCDHCNDPDHWPEDREALWCEWLFQNALDQEDNDGWDRVAPLNVIDCADMDDFVDDVLDFFDDAFDMTCECTIDDYRRLRIMEYFLSNAASDSEFELCDDLFDCAESIILADTLSYDMIFRIYEAAEAEGNGCVGGGGDIRTDVGAEVIEGPLDDPGGGYVYYETSGPDPDPIEVCEVTSCPFDACETGAGPMKRIAVDPIDVFFGDKQEQVVDLVVPMNGMDFAIRRSYTSNPEYSNGAIVGNRWEISTHRFLEMPDPVDPEGPGGTCDAKASLGDGSAFNTQECYNPNNDTWPTLEITGPTNQTINEALTVVMGTTYPTFRLEEPGQWEIDFLRKKKPTNDPNAIDPDEELIGLIKRAKDQFNNEHVYEHEIIGTGMNTVGRISRILLNPNATHTSADAEIRFEYFRDSGGTNVGKVKSIQVVRFDSAGDPFETQKVEYTYMDDADAALSDDLGRDGDLIQVVYRERVDPDPGSTDEVWRYRVRQYRYHGNASESTGARDYTWDGQNHQLKLIVEPQQFEYFAQKDNASANPAVEIIDSTDDLLALDDGDTAFTDGGQAVKVVDLAAKVIEEYETGTDGRVEAQFVKSSCGCGGGATQGIRLTYSYFTYNSDTEHTTKIVEDFKDGMSWTNHRTVYYDSALQGDPPGMGEDDERSAYLTTHAIVSGSLKWVTHHIFDSDERTLLRLFKPSAMSSYTPGTVSTAPSYTPHTDEGLVLAYGYTSDNYLSEVRLAEGLQDTSMTQLDGFTSYILQTKLTYGDADGAGTEWDSDNSRDHYISLIERYRDDGGSTAEDDVETTKLFYGFRTSGDDDIAWIEVQQEAEIEEENGPEGWYTSHELFDAQGNNFLSRDAANTLTIRQYDDVTGMVTENERNADDSHSDFPSGSTFHGLDISGTEWDGRNSDGGSLITQYTRDILGRVQEVTSPAGVRSFTRREMREFDDRPGVLYYSVVSLPREIDASGLDYNGPASVTWLDGGNGSIGSNDYEIDTAYTYDSSTTGYTQAVKNYSLKDGTDQELTKTVMDHDVSGILESVEFWHDVAGDLSYETTFEYDALGRQSAATNAEGTITERVYDALNRVVEVKVGTDNSGGGGDNMVTVAEYYYDHTGTEGSPVQGDGDGNLTLVKAHVDGSTTRTTVNTFDFRNRAIKVKNPLAPHQFMVYDNLNRAVEQAVFEDVPSDTEDLSVADSDRGRYVTTSYSQRGLAYKQSVAIDPTVASGSRTYLETNSWFDQVGRAVGTWGPNGPMTKTTFDGLGRPDILYVTDRRGDADPGSTAGSGSHPDVYSASTFSAVLTGDVVFEESEFRYIDGLGVVDLVTARQRTHDATDTDTGSLAEFSGGDTDLLITTYAGIDYDEAARPIRAIDFGTNQSSDVFKYGGSAPTLVSMSDPQEFDTDSTDLVSSTTYNVRGLADVSTSPEGDDTKTLYDDMNRRIAVVENYINGDVSWSTSYTPNRWVGSGIDGTKPAEDRITSFVYDGVSNVTVQTAHMPKSSTDGDRDQVTEYVYGIPKGASAGDSDIASNDILYKVHYPDETTGNRSTAAAFTVTHAYNRLGELKYLKDQNETVHDYTRDNLGRLTADKASTLGTDIDGAVRAIGTAFDDLGRVDVVHSYDDVAMQSGDIVNAVQFTYTKLWQVEDVLQEPYGDIDGSTLEVTYGYDDNKMTDGNWSRLDDLTYPDGESIPYNYGTSGDSNDVISRVFGVAKSGATDEGIQYHYVGLGMTAIVDYADPDVQMDRTAMHNGKRHFDTYTDTPGEYAGWDRYGRVVRHMWVDGDFSNDTSTDADRNPIVELTHTYDDDSNRLTRLNENPGLTVWPHRDYEYTYDGLDRLVEAERGTWGGSSITHVATQNGYEGAQEWALDMLGNWDVITVDDDADDSYEATEEDDRTHNTANELTDRDFDAADADLEYTYDDAGNLRLVKDEAGAVLETYTHDAWNRLVKVKTGAGMNEKTLSEYEYNGLNWRTIRRVDTEGDDDLNQVREMYYCASWQLREERIDDDADQSAGIDRHMQYIWGIRYIDDLCFRRENNDFTNDGSGITYEEERFHLHDVQFSTVAVLTETAEMVERVTYDPYGVARHHRGADIDGDGDVDTEDSGPVDTDYEHMAEVWGQDGPSKGDLTRDGDVTVADLLYLLGEDGDAESAGVLTQSTEDNIVGYDGYLFNAETQHYHVRFRCYAPELGRWIQRDPAGYVDGGNLYLAVSSSPISLIDPFGLNPCKSLQNRIDHKARQIAALKKKIANQQAQIKDREDKIRRNPQDLPEYVPGGALRDSVNGHRIKLAEVKAELAANQAKLRFAEAEKKALALQLKACRARQRNAKAPDTKCTRAQRRGVTSPKVLGKTLGIGCLAACGVMYDGCLEDAELVMNRCIDMTWNFHTHEQRTDWIDICEDEHYWEALTCGTNYVICSASCALPWSF